MTLLPMAVLLLSAASRLLLDDKIEMMATIELVRDGVAPSAAAPAPEPPTTLVGPLPSELSL